MRVLLYGMQSSGASVMAYTLAQKPDSVAFVDIWNMFAAPELETDRDSVAKVVVTTAFSLEVHRRRFRPDVTVLFLRHPIDTYYSLSGKSYENESGLIDEKFAVLNEVLRTGTGFDHVVHYEDFVFSPSGLIDLFDGIGWKISYDALLFGRTQREVQATNTCACPDIQGRLKYGAGNVQTRGVLRDRVRFAEPAGKSGHLPRLCPSLFDHYSAVRAQRGELWHIPPPALLSCGLDAILRGLTNAGAIPPESERAGYGLRLLDGTPQCGVSDSEIILSPPAAGRETLLTISGLPGRPFNRICGAAYAEDPRALGTNTRIRVQSTEGESLAEQEFSLCHSALRSVDLAFEPQASPITLSLGVRLAENAESVAHAGVRFHDLRLEQVTT